AAVANAISAAQGAKATVTTVGLVTPDFDRNALTQLANATKGQALSVGQSAQLAQAFQQVAQGISSQYVVSYTSKLLDKTLNVEVKVSIGTVTAADRSAVFNPRVENARPPSAGLPAAGRGFEVGAFAGKTGEYVGIA